MNYLGVDWGVKKIGLAVGDDEVKVASPFGVVKLGDKEDKGDARKLAGRLKRIIDENEVGIVIIGVPVSLAGDEKIKESLAAFVETIKELGVKVIMEDERMSTKMAGKLKREFSFAKKKQGDDDVAAAIILQSYFDRLP